MKRFSYSRSWRAGAAALACVGCSVFTPEVGPEQDSCGIDAASTSPSGATGYGMSGSAAGAGEPALLGACALDAGSACDDCESQFCCATRLACYGDPVCACADRALDRCLDSAGTASSRTSACWNSFTREGTVEAARVECQRTWCQVPCGVP